MALTRKSFLAGLLTNNFTQKKGTDNEGITQQAGKFTKAKLFKLQFVEFKVHFPVFSYNDLPNPRGSRYIYSINTK